VKDIFLSVVIPSYDEMANLQKGVLEKVKLFLDKEKFSYEVIVVDDGSKDGSVEFIKEFSRDNKEFLLVQNPHMGKGGAVTTGMLKAKGKYVLFTDMDQATPIQEIDKLLPYFDEGYDIVIGSRNTERKGAPLSRKFISIGSIVLRKCIVGLSDISDTQCGFKVFTNDSAKQLFKRISDLHNGFKEISGSAVTSGFDVELLYLADKMHYKIKEVPVKWLYVETRRVNPVFDSIEGLMDLLRIRKNAMTGAYNK
jgi:dolichyl-phosphate beta-glucosyltransferase